MARHLLDAADHAPFIVRLSKSGFHFAAYSLPFLLAHFLVNSAVGDDLHVPVREQQVNKNAVVVFGTPYPQLRKNVDRAFSRGLPRRSVAVSSAPSTTNRISPRCVASLALMALSIVVSVSPGKARFTLHLVATRCFAIRSTLIVTTAPTRRRRIPRMIYCENCGEVPVPDDQLPVQLPDDVEWKPTGESPLKLHPTWRFTTCPKCGGPAERETDTMDTFMCSSWYHLRYLSPDYDKGPFDPKEYDYWMPVDIYTGGIEHANMHLIYTRFFHKAMRDMGITEGHEPMMKLRNQGIVLGEDNEKMSKSRGNVVAPDDLVKSYGADTVRAFLMFFSRWDMGGPWSSGGIDGTSRWMRRIWTTILEPMGKVQSTESGIKVAAKEGPPDDSIGHAGL